MNDKVRPKLTVISLDRRYEDVNHISLQRTADGHKIRFLFMSAWVILDVSQVAGYDWSLRGGDLNDISPFADHKQLSLPFLG